MSVSGGNKLVWYVVEYHIFNYPKEKDEVGLQGFYSVFLTKTGV